MKIISFYNLKGGCGKTTLSCLFADYLTTYLPELKTALIDCDKQQQSATLWANYHARENLLSYLISGYVKGIGMTIKDIPANYILIDSPPAISDSIKSVLSLSDDIIIPIPPSQVALSSFLQESNLEMLSKVKESNPNINFHIVFNLVKHHENKIMSEAKQLLKNNDYVKRLDVKNWFTIGNRNAFVMNFNEDKSFTNTKNNKAKNEAKFIVSEVINKII